MDTSDNIDQMMAKMGAEEIHYHARQNLIRLDYDRNRASVYYANNKEKRQQYYIKKKAAAKAAKMNNDKS